MASSSSKSCPTTARSSPLATPPKSTPSRPCCSNSASSIATPGLTGHKPTARSSASGGPWTMTSSTAPPSTTSNTSPTSSSNILSTTTTSGLIRLWAAKHQSNLPKPRTKPFDQRISEHRQLRGAERRSNPDCIRGWHTGLLRFARNDESYLPAAVDPHDLVGQPGRNLRHKAQDQHRQHHQEHERQRAPDHFAQGDVGCDVADDEDVQA